MPRTSSHGVAAALVVAACVAFWPSHAAAQARELLRVTDAATVFQEIMGAPDGGIPKSILDKAEAIAIFPGVFRGAFGFGGQWGRGLIVVRNRSANTWSAPAFLTIAGGSFGAQIGGQSTDLVLVVMDPTGVQRLLGNQFKIGGEASAAAGPVGRAAEASTDIQLRAQILSYSRTRGLFAGVALNGSTLKADEDANQRVYGHRRSSQEVVAQESARQDLPDPITRFRTIIKNYAG
jgi:SH3 domain-containing YSC84-like protein 1